MQKSIYQTIKQKEKGLLNIYFTAGYPTLESVVPIITALADQGVDLIELGMPYSDPLADGATIQHSSAIALSNGQTISHLFEQVAIARQTTSIPIILMGYFNQLIQYGVERFIQDASNAGIQGLIIPDLPKDIYERGYMAIFEQNKMEISFLVTPMTSDERINQADRLSSGFVYIVSQSSITGQQGDFDEGQHQYFQKIKNMNLQSPQLLGFGIHDRNSFETACTHFNGAIVGSAFIRALSNPGDIDDIVKDFISTFTKP
jgi:tryptophan synthase alpha chain